MSNTEQIYGIHAVTSFLQHQSSNVFMLYVQEERKDQRIGKILDLAKAAGISLQICTRRELDERCSEVHQGVIAEVISLNMQGNEKTLEKMLEALDRPPFLLILDGITDPHNLGACFRSAEAAGIDAIIAPKDKSVSLTPTVRKVACGAAEITPFITVTNLARTLQNLQEKGIWIFGAAGEAKQTLFETDLKGPIALVLGSEGKGLRRLTRDLCDGLFSIPMAGEISSLNVSVATGVVLFEAVRQRQ